MISKNLRLPKPEQRRSENASNRSPRLECLRNTRNGRAVKLFDCDNHENTLYPVSISLKPTQYCSGYTYFVWRWLGKEAAKKACEEFEEDHPGYRSLIRAPPLLLTHWFKDRNFLELYPRLMTPSRTELNLSIGFDPNAESSLTWPLRDTGHDLLADRISEKEMSKWGRRGACQEGKFESKEYTTTSVLRSVRKR